jgi:ParB family transcriptional regulator, chromosome partitioning protein
MVFMYIPLDQIDPHPIRSIEGGHINDLRESIKVDGVLQPILVRPNGNRYEIVFGNHRYYAAKGSGLTEIPANVKSMTTQEAMLLALIENIQRRDMNPYEEGGLFVKSGLSIRELVTKLGKSYSYVHQRITIYEGLHQDLAKKIGESLTITNAYHIAKLPKETQPSIAERVDNYRKAETKIKTRTSGFGGNPYSSEYTVTCICPSCGMVHKRGK